MDFTIILVFILGYVAITLEHTLKIDKAATALVTGVLCWTVFILAQNHPEEVTHHLGEHMGEISQILFFLLGAMTIVEPYRRARRIRNRDGLRAHAGQKTPVVGRHRHYIFMSAILDNLTTTIVIVSLLRKLIGNRDDRLLFAGLTVVAANAGGAWSPMGMSPPRCCGSAGR